MPHTDAAHLGGFTGLPITLLFGPDFSIAVPVALALGLGFCDLGWYLQ